MHGNMFSSPDKFVLHYLPNTRAFRIAWLLQILNLDYELKLYKPSRQRLAPPELALVWPTGTSPLLQIFREGAPTKAIAESGHIVRYVIDHYDVNGILITNDSDDSEWVDYYLHFAEGSLQPHMVGIFVGDAAVRAVPWPLNIPLRALFARINTLFYAMRLVTNFKFLEAHLEKKGGGYFVGDHLTGADIMLDFPINDGLFGTPLQAEAIVPGEDPKQVFPNLYKWHQKIMNEPLRVQAATKCKARL